MTNIKDYSFEDFMSDFKACLVEEPVAEEFLDLTEVSKELLQTKAKITSLEVTLDALRTFEDEDVDIISNMLEKTKMKEQELMKTLNKLVEELVGDDDDFKKEWVKIAKKTRFSTSLNPLDLGSFLNKSESVQNRIEEETNELILRSNPEKIIPMLKNEKNDKIKRYVDMFSVEGTAGNVVDWIDMYVSDQTYNLRMKEQYNELLEDKIHTKATIETIASRWFNMSDLVKDKEMKEEEMKKAVETLIEFLEENLTIL